MCCTERISIHRSAFRTVCIHYLDDGVCEVLKHKVLHSNAVYSRNKRATTTHIHVFNALSTEGHYRFSIKQCIQANVFGYLVLNCLFTTMCLISCSVVYTHIHTNTTSSIYNAYLRVGGFSTTKYINSHSVAIFTTHCIMLSHVFGCILRQVDVLFDIRVTHQLLRDVIRTSAV